MAISITNNTIVRVMVRRGADSDRVLTTLAQGELGYTVDTKRLFIGNGLSGTETVAGNKFLGFTNSKLAIVGPQDGDTCYDEIAQAMFVYQTGVWEVVSPGTSVNLENSVSGLRIREDFAGLGLTLGYLASTTDSAQDELGKIALDSSYWSMCASNYGGAGSLFVGAVSSNTLDVTTARAAVQGPLIVTDQNNSTYIRLSAGSDVGTLHLGTSGTITSTSSAVRVLGNLTVTGDLCANNVFDITPTTLSSVSTVLIDITPLIDFPLPYGLRVVDNHAPRSSDSLLISVASGQLISVKRPGKSPINAFNIDDYTAYPTYAFAASGNTLFTNSTGSFVVNTETGIFSAKATAFKLSGGNLTVYGDISASGDIVAFFTSDAALKRNINPIENALDKILNIHGVEFDWDGSKLYSGHDVGVLAQDVEKQLPEAVGTRYDGFKGVNYHKIIPLIVEAIRELNGKIK